MDVDVPGSLYESIFRKVHEMIFILGHLWGEVAPLVRAKCFGYRAAIDVAAIFCSFHLFGEVHNIERVASSQC